MYLYSTQVVSKGLIPKDAGLSASADGHPAVGGVLRRNLNGGGCGGVVVVDGAAGLVNNTGGGGGGRDVLGEGVQHPGDQDGPVRVVGFHLQIDG